MTKANGRIKDKEEPKPRPDINGLDDEIATFINSLIEQNAELAGKLAHIDSLSGLADKGMLDAHKEAESILAEAQEKAGAAAQEIVAKAKEKAEEIVARAKQGAEENVQERLSWAEHKAQEILRAADGEASRIVAEARKRAEEPPMAGAGLTEPRSENAVRAAETAAISTEGERAAAESSEPRPAVCAQTDAVAAKEGSSLLYEDLVELRIPPPIALDQMLKLHKHLKTTPHIKVVELNGALDKGVKFKLLLMAPTPILSILAAMPEVQKVTDELIEAGQLYPAPGKGAEPSVRRIAVVVRN